jgi:hypothetical protein
MVRIKRAIGGGLTLLVLAVPATAGAALYTPASPGPVYGNTSNGSVTKTSSYWQTRANGPSGYARLMYRPSSTWTRGQTHSFGARLRVNGSSGYLSVLRADNYSLYGGSGYVFGVARYNSDGRGRLVVGTYSGNDQIIGPSFNIPVGQWFDLKVTMTLGSLISATINGSTVASGSFSTPPGKERVTSVRSGIVATGNSGAQNVQVQHLAIDQ